MRKYVFEKANSSLSNVEIQKVKYSNWFKVWLIFTFLIGLVSLCIVINENFILFFYDEIIKYEIGGKLIEILNNLLFPSENMIVVKKNTVFFILLMVNLINVGFGAIVLEPLETKDNK